MATPEYRCMNEYSDTWTYTRMVHRGGLSDLPPAMVCCAITGSNQGKEANPNLPETVDEQVRSTYEAYKAGASMVHIHRRDPNNLAIGMGLPAELFREINIKIREKCPDIIINDTCGCGCGFYDGKRSELYFESLYAEPEIISLDSSTYTSYVKLPAREGVRDKPVVREMIYSITQTEVELACKLCEEHGVTPEFECFQISDLYYIERLIQNGYTKNPVTGGPHLINFVFTGGSNWPTGEYISTLIKACPANSILAVAATGAQQWGVLAQALALGTHVRVGMEDNVYYARGKLAESNGQLVEKVVRMATDMDRRVATPAEARKLLGLGAPRTW